MEAAFEKLLVNVRAGNVRHGSSIEISAKRLLAVIQQHMRLHLETAGNPGDVVN
jgi:peptide deformylase